MFFILTPMCGEMIQFDEHIFSDGFCFHQLETVVDATGSSVVPFGIAQSRQLYTLGPQDPWKTDGL